MKFSHEHEIITILSKMGIQHTSVSIETDGSGHHYKRIHLANGSHVNLYRTGKVSYGGQRADDVKLALENGWFARQQQQTAKTEPNQAAQPVQSTDGWQIVATLATESLKTIADRARTTGQDAPLVNITLVNKHADASTGSDQQPAKAAGGPPKSKGGRETTIR